MQQLCEMCDPHEIATTRIIPKKAVDFLASAGFYSFLIPQKFGGLEFSANAISTIMAMITSHSPLLSTLVVIPNSLGAAELIKHYGTQGQKEHYLPRLACSNCAKCATRMKLRPHASFRKKQSTFWHLPVFIPF